MQSLYTFPMLLLLDRRKNREGRMGNQASSPSLDPYCTFLCTSSPLSFSEAAPAALSASASLFAPISYLSVHICYAIPFNFVQSSIDWDWGWVICEKPTVSLLISNGCLPGHLRCTEGMQKESIERLRVGAYQSSREEVMRRGKAKRWGVEKRCIERCTQREDQR